MARRTDSLTQPSLPNVRKKDDPLRSVTGQTVQRDTLRYLEQRGVYVLPKEGVVRGAEKHGMDVPMYLDHLLLQIEAGWGVAWRNNTGVLQDRTKRPVFYGQVGSPDIFLFVRGMKLIGLEAKMEDEKQSPGQVFFARMMTAMGGEYYIVRPSTYLAVVDSLHDRYA